MTINFISFDELFAPAYQLTYINTDGHIDVGSNTYSVFHYYTMIERQQIFQICEKHLPWEYTQEQEQWERTMYMYQFIIKSPPPFPYEEYPLSEDIIMAITWKLKITPISVERKIASIIATRTDSENPDNPKIYNVAKTPLGTQSEQLVALNEIWDKHQAALAEDERVQEFLDELEALGEANLEARE